MEKGNMPAIASPNEAVAAALPLRELDHEEVWLIYLTTANGCIGTEMVSKGTLNQTSIDNRTVIRQALLKNAAGIIVLHNHPSGTARPSAADIRFTQSLRKACTLMGLILIDHLIITENSFFSFAEDKEIKFTL